MPTVEVEVGLESFQTDDLVSELQDRVGDMTSKEIKQLRNSLLGIDTLDKDIALDNFLVLLLKP